MISVDDLDVLLRDGLRDLGLRCPEIDRARLLRFVELLRRWGEVYNLTSIDEPENIVRLHLLDSLSIEPRLHGTTVLDVGTGAGLPGIPLAIACPDRQFSLLDRSAKKLRFVQQAAIELGLGNVRVIHARVEQCAAGERYDTIVTRAYGSLADIWEQSRHLLAPDGVVLAMKGRRSELDLDAVDGVDLRVLPLSVPGLAAERHLVELRPGR